MKKIIKHLRNNWYKYAFETLVVILGVLIAYNLNNWSESHKKAKEASILKTKLINDLVADTLKINSNMGYWIKMEDEIEDYFDFFDNQNVSVDVLLDNARDVYVTYFRYFPINLTFEDMQQSGKMTLLSEEQRKVLIKLYHEQEFWQLIIDKDINDIKVYEQERNGYLDFDLSESDFYKKISWKHSIDTKRLGLLHQHNVFKGYHDLVRHSKVRAGIIIDLSKKCLIILDDDKNQLTATNKK